MKSGSGNPNSFVGTAAAEPLFDLEYLTATIPADEEADSSGDEANRGANARKINETILSQGSMRRDSHNSQASANESQEDSNFMFGQTGKSAIFIKDCNELSLALRKNELSTNFSKFSNTDRIPKIGKTLQSRGPSIQITSLDFNSKQSYNLDIDELFESVVQDKGGSRLDRSNRQINFMDLSNRHIDIKMMRSIGKQTEPQPPLTFQESDSTLLKTLKCKWDGFIRSASPF